VLLELVLIEGWTAECIFTGIMQRQFFIFWREEERYVDNDNVLFTESTLMMPPVGNEAHWRRRAILNPNKGGQGDE